MKLTVAGNIGFCFGVKRSIEITGKTLEKYRDSRQVYVTGDLVHNERVMSDLKKKGLKVLDLEKEELTNIPRDSVIIVRAHGLSPDEIGRLKNYFDEVLDTTCPIVKTMFETAKDLMNEGRDLFVFGNENHPEMIALKGYVKKAHFFPDVETLKMILTKGESLNNDVVGLISQTTKDLKNFCKASSLLVEKFKDVKIVRTICDFTIDREREVERLAKDSDLIIVIGSKKSSNTKKLFNIAGDFTKALLVSSGDQITDDLRYFKKIGLVSGTSTPLNLIEEVVLAIKNKFEGVEVLWKSQI